MTMKELGLITQNIIAGFEACGIVPLHSDIK